MTTSDTNKSNARRRFAPLAIVGVLLAVLIVGCGGSSKSSPSVSGAAPAARSYGAPPSASSANGSTQMPSAPNAKGQVAAAAAETGSIPQNGGGDQDADNNGGPSDGDGNV